MTRIEESDPLPFSQVHRAVKSRTALLAGALGVTTQHALGSMVEWWDLHSDPRVLESILLEKPEEPAVVVTGEEATATFQLASGKIVDPTTLVRLGFLERLDADRFRVRGMSRYFEPVARRLHFRTLAERGGKASAAARKASSGSAQPTALGSTIPEAEPEAWPEPSPNHPRTILEAEPEPSSNHSRTKRREVRGKSKEDLFGLSEPASRKPSKWEELWSELVDLRAAATLHPAQVFKPQRLNHLLSGAAAQVAEWIAADPDWPGSSDECVALRALWEIYLRNTFWRTKDPAFPLEGFASPKTLEKLWARLGDPAAEGEWS